MSVQDKIVEARLEIYDNKVNKTCQIMLIALISVFILQVGQTVLEPRTITIINPIDVAVAKAASPVASEDISETQVKVEEVKVASSVPDVIRQVAQKKGFKNVQGLLNLAHCESRFTPGAFNPTNNSNDRGVFQVSKKWHPEVSDDMAYNVEKATEWTIMRLEAGYGHEWMCFHAFENKNYIQN